MWQNYLITAFRNIAKSRLYSTINIVGLAIGLAAIMLIYLFVKDETSFDTWIDDRADIYRIHSAFDVPGRPTFKTINSAGGLMWDMPDRIPEIESFTRLLDIDLVGQRDGENFQELIYFVDPGFLDMFNLTFVEGTANGAFESGNSIIISQSTATRYFGNKPALGQVISFCCVQGEALDMQVSGVYEDIPYNSHMEMHIITPIQRNLFSPYPFLLESHTSVNVKTYLKLVAGTNPDVVKNQIDAYLNSTYPVEENDMGIDQTTDYYKINLMNVADIHLYARQDAADSRDMRPLGDITSVYIFSGVAILIMIIASINFMNLATARSAQRAREVSLRKVLGADRNQLVTQFLGESLLVTFMALAIAMALVEIALPTYNQTLDKSLSLTLFGSQSILPEFVIISTVIGLLSGIYPALVLSGYRPARILKANRSVNAEGSINLRNVLVIFQFTISIALATITGIVYAQTIFAKSADLGFSRDNKVILRGYQMDTLEAMKNDLLRIDGITAAVGASEVPTENRENNRNFGLKGSEESPVLNYRSVDYGFFEAYDIEPLHGRTFNRDRGTDLFEVPEGEDQTVQTTAMINTYAARRLGFDKAEDALGQIVTSNFGSNIIEFEVIGILTPIQYRSLRYGFHPVIYFNRAATQNRLTIAINGQSIANLLPEIEAVWRLHNPQIPFNYQILNDLIERQYASEDAQIEMFSTFSALAIFIACLGLFGLAAFSVSQKTKEIGLRKVMGARVRDIITLMLWQFSKPILLATAIALPLSFWYMMGYWLLSYENRIGLSSVLTAGVLATLISLFIAWITVAGHAQKVVRSNPINALRYE